jgi:hypothetical protein
LAIEPEARHRIFVETGRAGARKRWAGHEPHFLLLATLPPDVRREIMRLAREARLADAERAIGRSVEP